MTGEPRRSEQDASTTDEDARRLLHELQVRQIELELKAGLLSDLAELKRAEERSRSLISCLLGMGVDTEANINSLVALCGKTMGAACCLFNRVNHGLLCSAGQWQPPTGFKAIDKPDGHICYDVIRRADDKPFVIRNLPATAYAQSDPNVSAYGLLTYVGVAVKCHGQAVGSLCVVYQNDVEPSAEQLDFMSLLGFSIASEEERQRADEVLRESELRFRNLLQNVPAVAVQGYGPDGTTQYWNQASERLYGYCAQEAIGRNLLELIIPPEMRDHVRQAIRQMAETGLPIPASEVSLMRKDGSRVSVFSSHVVVQVPGRQQELFCMDVDLTERKAAEEAIQKSEEKFRAISNYTVGFESWFGPDGKFLWVNPAVEQITGYAADEILAIPDYISVLVAEEDRALCSARFKEAQSGNRGADFEFRGVRKNGSVYWLCVAWQPIFDGAGNSLGFRVSGQDITERKRSEAARVKLEEQLRQAQKMESVGRLAGGVAHDFNNMLSVILGHVEAAVEQLDPSHPVYASLVEINKAARRSAELTRQLLAFGRKQTIMPKVLDLNATVESMLKMLKRLIGEDIHLVWRPKTGLWPVKVDPSQIDQILVNLCVNARDAIADIGKLTIETDTSVFDEDDCATHAELVPGEYVVLSVSDTGCGMDSETLAHLFEPFFTTKETGKGTGLGLATVYGIVRQNLGFICVHSERNHGTAFKIYLPRYAGDVGSDQREGAAKIAPRGHETLLIVEDEWAILKMTAVMLEKQGYTVLAANSPSEAIQLAQEHAGSIRLLLTDVVMPEMNGRELASRLQVLYPDLKCLFISGYTSDVIAHHGVLDPGVHFIQKPVSLRDIAINVREVLDGV